MNPATFAVKPGPVPHSDIDALIIGAGQAGLAMSRCLADRNIRHVIVERGRIAQRWHTESWDSLRLLTPNDQTNLPGWSYSGNDPEGFMTAPAYISFLEEYARSFNAPLITGTNVDAVTREQHTYRVTSGQQSWSARAVIVATGHCSIPFVPGFSANIHPSVTQLTIGQYTNPRNIRNGGILVVGAGASGAQVAEELRLSGRDVTLSAGRHRRLPRRYRGKDILWWFRHMGIFDEPCDPGTDRSIPAPQLVGSDEGRPLDLGILQSAGVRIAGRISSIDDVLVRFEDNLQECVTQAELDMRALLERIDRYAGENNFTAKAEKIIPVVLDPSPAGINLQQEGINTVIWATGYRRAYPWLHINVTDDAGEIIHSGGITPEPGLFVIGMRRQIRYNSNFIDGVGKDAALMAEQVKNYLAQP